MTTIIGKIEDATGATLHARIDFLSKSTPLAGSGVVTTNTDTTIRSDPSTGEFSVTLFPGNYQVVISAQSQSTTFLIAVPDDDATHSIEEVVSTPLTYPFLAPNTVWNGQRAGHITFLPVPTPGAPTLIAVNVIGGSQGASDQSLWRVVWLRGNDKTLAGPSAANIPPTGSNNATRVFLPAPPTGVTQVYVYRSTDAGAHFYLEETVSPTVTFYDSGLSNTQFNAVANHTQVPSVLNTTAGGIFSSAGNAAAYVTDVAIYFPGSNLRIQAGKGAQLYNFDTGLWHTLTATGNPAQLGLDPGQ